MKKILILSIVLIFCNVTYGGVNWLTSFEVAQKEALATNKLMVVDFWASWCGPCKRMDLESWSKEEVKLLMDNYVAVKVDIDKERELSRKYGVNSIPFVFVMDGNGKVIRMERGYRNKSQVMEFLKTYAYNTAYFKIDLINYFKQKNFVTSYRLGNKIQKYALHLPMNVRYDFLKLAGQYFSESERYMKKSEMKDDNGLKQKLELHDIQELLIMKKSKKALKQLGKYNQSKIFDENKSFYALLNYVAHKQLTDGEDSQWESYLSENDIKLANLFLKTD